MGWGNLTGEEFLKLNRNNSGEVIEVEVEDSGTQRTNLKAKENKSGKSPHGFGWIGQNRIKYREVCQLEWTLIFKFQRTSESPLRLVKRKTTSPHSRVLDLVILGKFAFLAGLQFCGTYFKDLWCQEILRDSAGSQG